MTQEVQGAVGLGRQGDDSFARHGQVVKGWKKLTGMQQWWRVGYVSTLSSGEGLGWIVDECELRKQWAEEE